MGAHCQRLAGAVLALILSGTPALLAACALLCVPSATPTAATADHHAACCIPERDAPPTGHAHHGTATSAALDGVAPVDVAHLAGTGSCCPEPQLTSLAATPTGRADGALVAASPAVRPVTIAVPPTAGTARTTTQHRPLRTPVRPPLVLRI